MEKSKGSSDRPLAITVADNELAYGLQFTGDDLEANRAGFLTERQIEVLSSRKQDNFVDIVLACIVGSVSLCAVPMALQDFSFWLPSLICILLACFVIYAFWQKNRVNQAIDLDVGNAKVIALSGPIVLDTSPDQMGGRARSIKYTLSIGSDTFKLDKEAFLRFKHLEFYTIYFSPNSRTIVSAEPAG